MQNLISTNRTVSSLMQEFETGEIGIPEIQRDVVWSHEQVKELMDSISMGYPCGALIFWEPRESDKSIIKAMIRPERLEFYDGKLPRYFLLDGQQRLTALASVLLQREKLKNILAEMEEEMPYIFANIKKFPKEFEATTDVSGYTYPSWVLFNKLYDGSFENDREYANLTQDMKNRIRQHIQRIRDYQFPVQIIKERNYATVGEIFTRVNSAGTQLTSAEIHLASIVPYWKGITRELRDYRRDVRQKNYDIDLTFLIRIITAIECNTPQIKKLADKIATRDDITIGHLNKTWKTTKTAIDKTIRILRDNLNLDKSKFFTSKNALIPLVYHLAKTDDKNVRNILQFFLFSQLASRYGSAAETRLRKDFRLLADEESPKEGMKKLVKDAEYEVRQNYRGLKVKPYNISGLPSKNVMVLLMYILMRKRNATDWGIGKVLCLYDIEPKDMQLHHIFPFNFMKDNKDVKHNYETHIEFINDINDIANLTFLSQRKNVEIKDTPPSEYIPLETTKEMRKAHFIPEDKKLWKPENFKDFLEARRELLSKAMTGLLKKL